VRSSIPAPPWSDAYAVRGAQNLAARCLCVQRRETVHVLTWHAEEVFEHVSRAIDEVRGRVERIPLESLMRDSGTAQVNAHLAKALAGAKASVLLAAAGLPVGISRAVLQGVERAGTRHLHVVNVDIKLLGQSMRADPDVLTTMNERLLKLLQPPSRIHITSALGTALDVALSPHYPVVAANGRPDPGRPENLPSGLVYTHPSQVSGVYVADRAVHGEGMRATSAALRRTPIKLQIASGRVSSVSCADAHIAEQVDRYLASHADAARVGMVVFPTNYLARSEVGLEAQDALLPGVNLGLGFSMSAITRAHYDAPVQLRLMARRLNVEVHGVPLVTAGRFEAGLVEGIDPFR